MWFPDDNFRGKKWITEYNKKILLLAAVIQGFDGHIQQGCELQDQVIEPGHHSLKSHCELLKMLLFLTHTEHFWNLRMEKVLTSIIKDSSVIDSLC